MDEHLTIEWIDPRGKVWNLTDGTEGVLLDVGQSDFHLSTIEHQWVRGGMQWAGSQIQRAEPSLKVLVGDTLSGSRYYRLADEWWSLANSASAEGVLRVTRPDGEVRELRCRLRDTPATEWDYDPGAGIADVPGEPWLLSGATSFWEGPEQSVSFSADVVAGGGGVPFYGADGHGWPLYIAPLSSASDLFLSNLGQGPQWLTWTLIGPITSITFGVEGGWLSYEGGIAAGEQVVVTTEPGYRYAVEAVSGDNRYTHISGTYAPVPVGDRIPLHIVAEGMTAESSVIVTAREQFVKPF